MLNKPDITRAVNGDGIVFDLRLRSVRKFHGGRSVKNVNRKVNASSAKKVANVLGNKFSLADLLGSSTNATGSSKGSKDQKTTSDTKVDNLLPYGQSKSVNVEILSQGILEISESPSYTEEGKLNLGKLTTVTSQFKGVLSALNKMQLLRQNQQSYSHKIDQYNRDKASIIREYSIGGIVPADVQREFHQKLANIAFRYTVSQCVLTLWSKESLSDLSHYSEEDDCYKTIIHSAKVYSEDVLSKDLLKSLKKSSDTIENKVLDIEDVPLYVLRKASGALAVSRKKPSSWQTSGSDYADFEDDE